MRDALKTLACLCLLGATLASLASCGGGAPAAAEAIESSDRPLRIVATIRPLELIALELLNDSAVADRVEVSSIVAPEVSPHGFEPTASQVAALQRADIVIYNGHGLDDWAARGLRAGAITVRFEDVVDLDHDHHHHHHPHDEDHVHGPDCNHGPIDEHFWVDPELVEKFALSIALQIARVLHPGRDDALNVMQEPLRRFTAQVQEVDERLGELLSAHQGKRIVTHHNVFQRLADRYGLGTPIVLRPLAVLEPTPGDLRRAIEAIRAENIRAIFIEPQFSADAAKRVQEETQTRLVLVDPLGAEARNWSDLMTRIGEALAQGLSEQ